LTFETHAIDKKIAVLEMLIKDENKIFLVGMFSLTKQ